MQHTSPSDRIRDSLNGRSHSPVPLSDIRKLNVCMSCKKSADTTSSHSSSIILQNPTSPIPDANTCGVIFASLGFGDVDKWFTESQTPGDKHQTAMRQIAMGSSKP